MSKPHFLSRLGVVPGILSLLAGCGGEPPPPLPGPPVVTVAIPVKENVTDHIDFIGQTAAVESVELRARVGGYLKKVGFTEGSEVKLDQVLFVVDPDPYQAELEQAQARVKAAQARVTQAEADHQRTRQLYQRRAATEEDLEKALRTRDVTVAALDAAQANVKVKQLNLDFTNVLAPIHGRADKANVTPGNLVSGNLINATILTNLVQLEPMYAYFDVDELTMLRILRLIHAGKLEPREKKAPEVLLGLGDGKDYPIRGTIDFVGNQVNPTDSKISVRGVFANKDRVLVARQQVHLRVPLGGPHPAVLVNDRALGTNQGQKFLFLVNDKNQVEYRPVTVGALHGGLREIVDGLKPGERVIINGLLRVRPGVTVEAKPGEMRPEPVTGKKG